MDLKNSNSNFVRGELGNYYRITKSNLGRVAHKENNFSLPKLQTKIKDIKISKCEKSQFCITTAFTKYRTLTRNRTCKHNNISTLTLSNSNIKHRTLSIMSSPSSNNNNRFNSKNNFNRKHLKVNSMTLEKGDNNFNSKKGNCCGNGLFRIGTDYQTVKEKMRQKINMKLSIDLMNTHSKKKANTDCESLSSLTNNEYKSTDTGQAKSLNDKCRIKLTKKQGYVLTSHSNGDYIEKQFDIEMYKEKQRQKLKLPLSKEHISNTVLKMANMQENILKTLHNKYTKSIKHVNTFNMKLFSNSKELYSNTYECLFTEYSNNKQKDSTIFSKQIYKQFFTYFPYPKLIINTHHINANYYNPTITLFELKKEKELHLNSNNESMQRKITLFSNFDIHNEIITPLMLTDSNKCTSIQCKGSKNCLFIINSLYKSLPYEIDLHSSSKTKIINVSFKKRKSTIKTKQSKSKEISHKKEKTLHQLILTSHEKVKESEKKISNFTPTFLPNFYNTEHEKNQDDNMCQKIKESLFKTEKRIMHTIQNDKLCNNYLTIEKSKNRTQEMYTSSYCAHSLNQLILYIHTNQKNAFINYFVKQNCKEIINQCDSSGNVLLIHAIQYNQKEIITFLIENGADVNIANWNGNTPLHFAFSYKYYNIVNELIKCNANEYAQNLKGATPWECLGLTCE